ADQRGSWSRIAFSEGRLRAVRRRERTSLPRIVYGKHKSSEKGKASERMRARPCQGGGPFGRRSTGDGRISRSGRWKRERATLCRGASPRYGKRIDPDRGRSVANRPRPILSAGPAVGLRVVGTVRSPPVPGRMARRRESGGV